MKIKTTVFVGAAGLVLASCIPSVNPYYTESDVVFAAALIGEWTDGGGETWTFVRSAEGDSYELTIVESSGSSGEMTATLFELDDHRFLDLIPKEFDVPDDQADFVSVSLFAGHLVLHVEQTEPTLELALFDFDWLEDHLEENPRALGHRVESDRILLTGSTRELQRFLRRHVDGGELFDEYNEFTKESAGD